MQEAHCGFAILNTNGGWCWGSAKPKRLLKGSVTKSSLGTTALENNCSIADLASQAEIL